MAVVVSNKACNLAVLLQVCILSVANAQYLNGGIQLVGGSYPWEGRVEIYMSGTWGTVTDSDWNSDDAQVVCRKMGYFKPGAIPLDGAYFGEGSGAIHLNYVLCSGTEYNLTDCETSKSTRIVTHAEDVGVSCQPAPGTFQDGNIRLVGGSNNWEGRVEMYMAEAWGIISDNSWTTTEARVVCRQLGHSAEGAVAHCCAPFDQGSSSTHIINLSCQGSESNITSCSYSYISSGTSHLNDVGVECQHGSVYREGDIRLVNGSYNWEGRVEIFLYGTWGTIEYSSGGKLDAHVACQHLGYDTRYGYLDISRGSAYFGVGPGPVHLRYIRCSGVEHRLLDCIHDNNTYDDSRAWSVTCNNDGPESGDVRLCYSTITHSSYYGRVQIFLSGTWGGVTGSWTRTNAEVVCHQLGYEVLSSSISLSSYYFPSYCGRAPIHMHNVDCYGSEAKLTACPRNTETSGQNASMDCGTSGCNTGDTRLVEGQTEREGRVEVCSNRKWGTVCINQWSPSHTRVVCRYFGYEGNDGSYFSSSYFGQGTVPIVMDYVNCSGSEFRLYDCNHFTHSYGCTHSDDVGVRCQPAQCEDGVIRLVEGATDREGRLEVCLGQRWGTICDNYFYGADAQTVCKQLGYSATGATVPCCTPFGRGGGPIHLTYVECTGTELRLLDCTHNNDTLRWCNYMRDIGVQCQPSTCVDGEMRLMDGETEVEGRLELCLGQRWGTVSNEGWTETDAEVVCRDLGYEIYTQMRYYPRPARNSKPMLLKNVACSGLELTLLDCSYDSEISEDIRSIDVGIHCQKPTCLDGDVRLVDGDTEYSGLVEVCFSQRWGTVNGDGWSSADTQVVCKQLGYQTTDVSFSLSGHTRRISAPIFMDNVACFGSEDNLIECTYHTDTSEDDHSTDVRVHCKPSTNAIQGSTNAISVVALTLVIFVSLIAVAVGSVFIMLRYRKKKNHTSSTERVQHHIPLHGHSVADKMRDGFEKSENSRYAGHPLPHEAEHPVINQSASAAPYQPLCISGQVMPEPYETCETTTSQADNPRNMLAAAAEDIYESCT